jgi:hypothetical protein
MTTDRWLDGEGDWRSAGYWSAGEPTASSDVVINSGNPQVRGGFGTVNSIRISGWADDALLTFTDALNAASSVTGNVTLGSIQLPNRSGRLLLDPLSADGGSTLRIGGTLNLYDGVVQIGPSDNTLSAPSTIEAVKLANGADSTIDLYGSSTAQATLDVASAAGFGTAGVLTGYVYLSGDALVEFGGGQITTLAANAVLNLTGSHAFVADASDTSSSSALRGLRAVEGILQLANGATVTTSGPLTNSGTIYLDSQGLGIGGSLLNISGTLTNTGTITMGNAALSAGVALEAANVVNDGAIDIGGSGASLKIVHSITLDGGTITFIGAGTSSVSGGVTVGESTTVSGELIVDQGNTSGGSSLTIGATLNNSYGLLWIGNSRLSAPSTVEAARIVNVNSLYSYNYADIQLYGSATARATLDITSSAGFGSAGVLYGDVFLTGNTLIEFSKGEITTIAADAHVELAGSDAVIADASNTTSNSALTGLRTVSGTLDLEDGAAVTRPGGLTVGSSGAIELNAQPTAGGDGARLTVTGTLTNDGSLSVDSPLASIAAGKVVNDGAIDMHYGGPGTFTCGGAFINNGSVTLDDCYKTTIGGAVRGTGDFNLEHASVLEFVNAVSSGQSVIFGEGVNQVNHLSLDSPSSFAGAIEDFTTTGDSVTAKTFAEAITTLTYAQTGADSCSWTLTQGAQTAVLNFAGAAYAQSDFSISPSANGAVLIKHV